MALAEIDVFKTDTGASNTRSLRGSPSARRAAFKVHGAWQYDGKFPPRPKLQAQFLKVAAQADRPMLINQAKSKGSNLSLQLRIVRRIGTMLGSVSAGVAILAITLLAASVPAGELAAAPRLLALLFVFSLLSVGSFYMASRLRRYATSLNI